MQERKAAPVVAGIGLGFLALPVLILLWPAGAPTAREASPFVASGPLARASRRGSTDQALREAAAWEVLARQTAHDSVEAPAAWGAASLASANAAAYRRRLADDAGGYLRRARRAALRAAQLARTPDEARRASELLTRLEYEEGESR
jgi:hypothetical protein